MTNVSNMARKAALLLSGLFLFWATVFQAQAHRLPLTTTEIRWNTQTSALEVIHNLHVHDAELGLALLLNDRDVSLQDFETQARLALHVEENFSIKLKDGTALDFEIVGVEADGDYAVVYQQVVLEAQPKALLVHSSILNDLVPDQENQVHIELFDIVQSLVFRGEAREKLVQF